mmetsp:Transcript_23588/g.65603  ORF Transcript_23588/g.65603 Transcript_23588/m.65603 type:complete len:233 (-) Transcript_23588:314-1012(-)
MPPPPRSGRAHVRRSRAAPSPRASTRPHWPRSWALQHPLRPRERARGPPSRGPSSGPARPSSSAQRRRKKPGHSSPKVSPGNSAASASWRESPASGNRRPANSRSAHSPAWRRTEVGTPSRTARKSGPWMALCAGRRRTLAPSIPRCPNPPGRGGPAPYWPNQPRTLPSRSAALETAQDSDRQARCASSRPVGTSTPSPPTRKTLVQTKPGYGAPERRVHREGSIRRFPAKM